MSSKQGNGRNRITAKRLCLLSLLTALSMALSFLETVLPFGFSSFGIKLGLANGVCIILMYRGDFKGAVSVNLARIILSSVLFSSAVALIFSLSGAIVSMTAAALLLKSKKFGLAAVSSLSGVLHNCAQAAVAVIISGKAMLNLLPLLIVSGALCGAACGIISSLFLKKIKTNLNF